MISPAKENLIYRIAAYSCIVMLGFIPIQIVVFAAWPPPETVEGFYQLFATNPFLGLLSLDLLYLINNALIVIIYFAIYLSIKPKNKQLLTLAFILGLVGVAAYYPTNPAFEFWNLSKEFMIATTETRRTILLAAGEGVLAGYTGTAFDVYYVLNAFTLLVFCGYMFRSKQYSRTLSWFGIVSGFFMLIPSTVGLVGMIFSLLSLIPWMVFIGLLAFRYLSNRKGPIEPANEPIV